MLKNFAFGAICVLTYAVRLSAAPALNLELNPDGRSYRFVLSSELPDNQSTPKDFQCDVINVVAAVGPHDCEFTLATYIYNDKNRKIKNGDKTTNPTFGIDFVEQTEKHLKRSNLTTIPRQSNPLIS